MAPLETSRRLRKKNNTHKALLHAAKKLFEEKGIDIHAAKTPSYKLKRKKYEE